MSDALGRAVSVYLFAVLGIFLVVAPWTPVWDEAVWAVLPGLIGSWASTGWVRGIVSGLGTLDLVVAAADAHALWRELRGPDARHARGRWA